MSVLARIDVRSRRWARLTIGLAAWMVLCVAVVAVFLAPPAGAEQPDAYDYDTPSRSVEPDVVPATSQVATAGARIQGPSHCYDDLAQPAPTSASLSPRFLAPQTQRDLYKAPRGGDFEDQLARGCIPDDTFNVRPPDMLPGEVSSNTVFFTLQGSRARSIAAGPLYDGRVIAVRIPPDLLDQCEGPDDFGDEDIEVPFDVLPLLNTFPRRQA